MGDPSHSGGGTSWAEDGIIYIHISIYTVLKLKGQPWRTRTRCSSQTSLGSFTMRCPQMERNCLLTPLTNSMFLPYNPREILVINRLGWPWGKTCSWLQLSHPYPVIIQSTSHHVNSTIIIPSLCDHYPIFMPSLSRPNWFKADMAHNFWAHSSTSPKLIDSLTG